MGAPPPGIRKQSTFKHIYILNTVHELVEHVARNKLIELRGRDNGRVWWVALTARWVFLSQGGGPWICLGDRTERHSFSGGTGVQPLVRVNVIVLSPCTHNRTNKVTHYSGRLVC